MVLPLDKNDTGFANTGNYVNLVPRARAHLRSAGSKCHGLWDNQKPDQPDATF